MFFGRFRYFPFLLASAAGCMSGCGGGASGPQSPARPPATPTSTPTPVNAPVASGRIVWMSDRDGTSHLYVMNGDGTGQVRLTRSAGLERSPSWSADGSKIVFSYSPDKTLAGAEIYSIDSDGTHITRLTNNVVEDDLPSLSRDGQFLTWSAITGDNAAAVMVARSDGGAPETLSGAGETARTSCFDAQGRVLFAAKSGGTTNRDSKYQIVRANRDGTGRVVLCAASSNLFAPSVSFDGASVVFTDDASGDLHLAASSLNSPAPRALPFSVAGDSDPRFTPDGRLVFSSLRDGNAEIYSCNADGTSPQRLTSTPASDRLPSAR